jgi:MYXO-CTERM domain-containing protein
VVEPALDADLDGLDDACEEAVVLGFEPELVFGVEESKPARVPFWAARRDGPETLRLFYALSYLEDAGDPDLGGSGSHDGDSEFIVLRVQYDGAGSWSLVEGYLSANYQAFCDTADWLPATAFQWKSDVGGKPLVFVAEGSHANYPSIAACDAGGCFQDHCTDTTREPAGVIAGRDLGLRTTPIVDDYAINGNSEWYWTNEPFCGWKRPAGDARDGCAPADNSYSNQLDDFAMDASPSMGVGLCEACVDDTDCKNGGRCFDAKCTRACESEGCPGGSSCAPDPGFGSGQCEPDTTCECIAACMGRACGDPGCGASCGTCAANEMCSAAGQCVPKEPECVPQCEGKQCGDDGCGNVCGNCPNPEDCQNGVCIDDPSTVATTGAGGETGGGGEGGGGGDVAEDEGCRCATAGGTSSGGGAWGVVALAGAWLARRRRGTRRASGVLGG